MTAEMTAGAAGRRSPLGALAKGEHVVARNEWVRLIEIPFLAQVNLRGDPSRAFLDAVEGHLGVRPPTTPNRRSTAGGSGVSALWLAPDEWLIVGHQDARALTSSLEAVVRAVGGSIVDVSAHRTVLEIRGLGARDLLMSGCSIDLHPRVFEVGHAAQTQLARVDVIVARLGPDTYQVHVRASFARYLADWLKDAMGGVEGGPS